jgi:hypothetical protein
MKMTPISVALVLLPLMSVAHASTDTQPVNASKADSATVQQEQLQDMSDPLAVYTQAGFGITDKGLNVKIGQAYDTGSSDTVAMNIIEVKGFAGEQTGWSGSSERDNSIDSVRFRNFSVNTTNGRGAQIDMNYNVENEQLDASYSFIQALPKWGAVQLYPLAGVGARVMNGEIGTVSTDTDSYTIDKSIGYTIPGVYGVVGMYSRITVTDKIWINYNPMWLTSIAGSDGFMDSAFGAGESSIFTNEFSVSYQFTPRFNTRYFANWTQDQAYFEGEQRIEFNYQF